MARTKNASGTTSQPQDPMEEKAPVDCSREYGCPFPIFNPLSGGLFQRFSRFEITVPRYFDWGLMESLGLMSTLKQYLKNLGMDKFAMMELPGYSPLCLEVLTTFDLADDFSQFTCRMFGREYTVTDRVMKRVFGFPLEGFRKPPPEFDVAEAWEFISGFNNWGSGGMASGFIKDHALGILHKFLVYNVSGNSEANKVNTGEVFLLTAAIQNVKVCPTAFIFEAF